MRRVVIIANHVEPLGMEIIRGAVNYAVDEGPWVLVSRGALPAVLDLDDLERLNPDRLDGIVGQVYGNHQLARLHRWTKKIVNVSTRFKDVDAARVTPDDAAIGRLGAEHFIERGYGYLAFAGFAGHHYSDLRLKTFAEVARAADKQLFVLPQPKIPTNDHGPMIKEIAAWLRTLPKPVAVMGCNDNRARHILTAAEVLGLHVPEEVAVLGVDHDEWTRSRTHVPLSSIDPAPRRVGFEAARLLARLMAGEAPPDRPISIPPVGVITRRSTEAIAVDDPVVVSASQYIRSNADRMLTVEEVVEASGCSRRLLETRFRTYLGCTPQDAIWRSHVDRAKLMLEQTNLPAKTVAQRCGFGSAERLSVVFRRYTGQTPTNFRKQRRQDT